MDNNVIKLEKFKVGKSTLAEMYEEITEGSFPFLTLNICDSSGGLYLSSTIAWARFREDEQRKDFWQIRSSDDAPNTPTQYAWVSKHLLSKYVLTHQESRIRYVFQLTV